MMAINTKIIIPNTLGTLTYLFILIEWMWAIIVLGFPFLSGDFELFLPAPSTEAAQQPLTLGPLEPIATFAAIMTSILVLLFTAISLANMPKQLAIKSKRATNTIAKRAIPRVVPKRELTKSKTIELSLKVSYALKLLAIGLPLAAVSLVDNATPLTKELTIIVGSLFALCAVSTLGLQMFLAKILKIPLDEVW